MDYIDLDYYFGQSQCHKGLQLLGYRKLSNWVLWCRILSMYDIDDEDVDNIVDQSQLAPVAQTPSLQRQLPVTELLKVCVCFCFAYSFFVVILFSIFFL